jgi:hypothetical protein
MKRYGEDVVRLMTLNLEVDGGEDVRRWLFGGKPPERWRAAHEEIIAPRRPDLLLRQEARRIRRLRRAERVLGMRGFLGPKGQGHNRTALFLRPETFQFQQRLEQLKVCRCPPTIVMARLREVPDRDIIAASWHARFNGPNGRMHEADEITALADKVKSGTAMIGGGDCNEFPVPVGETVPPIDWSSPDITDLVHVRHRTTKAPDGSRVGCTYLDETLLGCGLHDPARYAAHTLGQADALNATAGHAPGAAGQGGKARIDRMYLDGWLVQAVLEVNVVDTTGVSDHHGVEVILSRRRTAEGLRREFDPLPPMSLAA